MRSSVTIPMLVATAQIIWPLAIPSAVSTPPERPPMSVLRIVTAVSGPGVTITMSETPRNARKLFMRPVLAELFGAAQVQLMQTADRGVYGGANDPRRIVRGRFVGVEPGEIDCIAVAWKWRGHDRSGRHHGLPGVARDRHHRLAGASGDAAKVVSSVQTPDQIPSVALEAAFADVKHSGGREPLANTAE